MESSGIQVILPNMIEFIPMLIAFIVVAIILWKFGWPKLEKMLEERKNSIESALKESEEKRIEAENLLNEYKKKLEEAEIKADEIIKEAKISGLELGKKIEDNAKDQAKLTTEKAEMAIDQKQKAAELEIKQLSVDIAMTALKKFISNDLDDEKHRKLIEKYVKESGNISA